MTSRYPLAPLEMSLRKKPMAPVKESENTNKTGHLNRSYWLKAVDIPSRAGGFMGCHYQGSGVKVLLFQNTKGPRRGGVFVCVCIPWI